MTKIKILKKYKQTLKYYPIILLILVILCSFFSYSKIAKFQLNNIENPKFIIVLIIFNLVLFTSLAVIILRKLVNVWQKSKEKSSKIQNKIILMFCLVASVPTVIVTVFSIIFFNFGIQSWFNQRVSTAINESVVVAESYFKVQWTLIESDVRIMAQDINFLLQNNSFGPKRLSQYLTSQAEDKSLVEAVIFQIEPKSIIAESRFNISSPFSSLSGEAIKAAVNDKIPIIQGDEDTRVRALIKLESNYYLLIARTIDNKVLDHMTNTKGAASEYEMLKNKMSSIQISFLFIFIIISLLLLLIAIWLGIILSSALIKPLNSLVSATEQISEGNFAIDLNINNQNDEISVLANAFNTMVIELGMQREKLIAANREIEARHHFSQTVLSGVSAGIVALDLNLNISVINPAAQNILNLSKNSNLAELNFSEACPEIAELLPQMQNLAGHEIRKEVIIHRGNKSSILAVRIINEKFLDRMEGYIITFDDITSLIFAQRTAAWSDVARKIAHEIKNPLTPIYLAAERLKRKYSSEVGDVRSFDRYLEMIIKHAKDIGTIVEEFVQFARMPAPNLGQEDFVVILRDAIFSRKCLEKNIKYIVEIGEQNININCDARQISQVLLNLFKNAEESIEQASIVNHGLQGEIVVKLIVDDKIAELYIIDNGIGFSAKFFDSIAKPYITTKATGTGLGLAIVKKILDDHNIEISFTNNFSQGAIVKLLFKEIF